MTNCGSMQQNAQTATLSIANSPLVPLAIILSKATLCDISENKLYKARQLIQPSPPECQRWR